MKALAIAAFSLDLFFVLPSSAQVAANAPANTGSGRIQNIAPEEMWKRVTQCVLPSYPWAWLGREGHRSRKDVALQASSWPQTAGPWPSASRSKSHFVCVDRFSQGRIVESTHWMVLHRPVELAALTGQVKCWDESLSLVTTTSLALRIQLIHSEAKRDN
jgi:hypothetical protein